jgi:hypothetical protein
MKMCMYVCQAAGHTKVTQPITPKFGMGSSFHQGLAPSQGATRNVGPGPVHRPDDGPAHFCSLDQGFPTWGTQRVNKGDASF